MDTLLLSRLQFGMTFGFHALFPALAVVVAWLLVHLRLRFQRSGDVNVMRVFRAVVKVLVLTLALGVVTGAAAWAQFAMTWPGAMQTTGAVIGPLLGIQSAAVIGTLPALVLLVFFDFSRIPDWVHLLAAVTVALGMVLWLMGGAVLEGWMLSPAGVTAGPEGLVLSDLGAVLLNPAAGAVLVTRLLSSALAGGLLLIALAVPSRIGPVPKAAADLRRLGLRLSAVGGPGLLALAVLHPTGGVSGDAQIARLALAASVLAVPLAIWAGSRVGRALPAILMPLAAVTTLAAWAMADLPGRTWLVSGLVPAEAAVASDVTGALTTTVVIYGIIFIALLLVYGAVLRLIARGAGPVPLESKPASPLAVR